MPELPEVEALAADLRGRVVGQRVDRIDVSAISALKTFDPPPTALHGREVTGAGRYGKFLDIEIGGSAPGAPDALHLVTHLSRAGWLQWREKLPPAPPKPGRGPIAARLHLDDGSGFDLTEAGTQKKLAAYLVTDPLLVPGVSRLGPDALGVDPEGFAAAIRGQRAQLKGVLTEQQVISGIGNAYSDEILHRARLSPVKLTTALTEEELARLLAATRTTLAAWIERLRAEAGGDFPEGVTAFRKEMAVHGKYGQPCPVCEAPVQRIVHADNETNYCARCQTGGKLLADRALSRLLKKDWPRTLEEMEARRRGA